MMRSVKSIHAEIPADEGRTPHPHSLSVANFPISLGDHHSTLATTHPVEWTGVPGPKSLETIFSPVPYLAGATGLTSCHGFFVTKISLTIPYELLRIERASE